MMRIAFVLLFAACATAEGPEFEIQPGSTGADVVGTSETPPSTPILRGRVCVVTNLVTGECEVTTAGGLTVALGEQVAVTNADGTFEIVSPVGTSLTFQVTGPELVTTTQALTARAEINALRRAAFEDMLTAIGATEIDGTGSVVATVFRGGVPVSGVTATSMPLPVSGPFFAGSEPMPWTTNATGVSGIVWFPGVMVGPAELSFNTLTGGTAIVGGVQVVNGGITMVETPLP